MRLKRDLEQILVCRNINVVEGAEDFAARRTYAIMAGSLFGKLAFLLKYTIVDKELRGFEDDKVSIGVA